MSIRFLNDNIKASLPAGPPEEKFVTETFFLTIHAQHIGVQPVVDKIKQLKRSTYDIYEKIKVSMQYSWIFDESTLKILGQLLEVWVTQVFSQLVVKFI